MITGFLRAIALCLSGWALEIIGFVVVAIALPFRRTVIDPERPSLPFSQFPERGSWSLVRLPAWALWWDNKFDGVLGDRRGWWANECDGKHTAFVHMWRWTALRNPTNYFSRIVCGVDVSTLRIVQVAGNISDEGSNGFSILNGMAENGKAYPRLYAEYKLSATHGLMLDVGYKIKLSHNGRPSDAPEVDRIKGIVLTVSFWKELA